MVLVYRSSGLSLPEITIYFFMSFMPLSKYLDFVIFSVENDL